MTHFAQYHLESRVETAVRVLATARRNLEQEERSDAEVLHLTANENVLSRTVQSVLSSSLASRYVIGTLSDYADKAVIEKDKFSFRGMPSLARLEAMAQEAFRRRLGGTTTEIRPLSGLHCMMCALMSLSEPGDVVLSIDPKGGGHFATQTLVSALGRKSVLVEYDANTLQISLERLAALGRAQHVKLAFLDEAAPLYPPPFRQIREALGLDTIIVYDASHTLGLVMGGMFGDPIGDGCDVVQGNTHKTFPGPQKGLMHFAEPALANRAMSCIGSALVSSQHTHHSAALFLSTLEMDLFGAEYARQVVANAQALCDELEARGFELLEYADQRTQSHQLLALPPKGISAGEACTKLFASGISTNAREVYGKEVMRFGVQEVTRRGMGRGEMSVIAELVKRALLDGEPSARLRGRVAALRADFKTVRFSFDDL